MARRDGCQEKTYTPQKRRRTEGGELWLRNPGATRWLFTARAGKRSGSDQSDFSRFTWRPEGPDTWIVAEPRSDRLAYTRVGFLVDGSFGIKRLEITGQDQSVMEYRFEGERMNPPLEESLFRFQPPPGAEVVDVESGNAQGTADR